MSWNQFNTFLIPRSPRPRRPESPHGTGVLAIPAQFIVAWIVTVTRWAAPPAEIITKSRVSYEFSALFEKLVVLEPEVEQVRFELRMFVPFLPMLITGVTEGLTPEGILQVRRDDGAIEKILSGQVRSE